jgi:hypothetical protein
MAEPKPTLVLSPPFSTIITPCSIDQLVRHIDLVADRAEQDARFKQIHRISRKDWDVALSLHLHGDPQ